MFNILPNIEKNKKLIIVLVLISFIKGLIWAIIIPAFQGPDEVAYFSYVQFLAENKSLPDYPYAKTGQGVSDQLQETLSKLDFHAVKFNNLSHQTFNNNSLSGPNEDKINQLNLNPKPEQEYHAYDYYPVYPLLNLPWYHLGKTILNQLFLMRFWSVILSTLTIMFVYLSAKQVFKNDFTAFCLGLMVSFQPMFSHLSSLLHIDVWMNLGFSAVSYYCLKLLSQPGFKKDTILQLIFWTIVTFFTKLQARFVFPFIAIALLIKAFREQTAPRKWLISISFVAGLIPLVLTRNHIFYKVSQKFLTLSDFLPDHSPLVIIKTLVIKLFLQPIYVSFWGNFGWLDLQFDKGLYILIAIFLFLSLIGLIKYFLKSFLSRQKPADLFYHLFFVINIIFLTAAYFLVSIMDISPNSAVLDLSQGRYFFLLITPLFALIVKGYLEIFPNRFRLAGLFLLTFSMILLNLISIFNYLIPRYYL